MDLKVNDTLILDMFKIDLIVWKLYQVSYVYRTL